MECVYDCETDAKLSALLLLLLFIYWIDRGANKIVKNDHFGFVLNVKYKQGGDNDDDEHEFSINIQMVPSTMNA